MLQANDIKSRVDLRTQVIEPDIGPGQREGDWYAWLCPFHDDRRPSLKLKENDTHFHCFACGAHGDALDWLQQRNNWDFKTALNHLASLTGTSSAADAPALKPASKTKAKVTQPPDRVWQDKARDFINRSVAMLWKTPQAQADLRSWGLLGETMREWQLGWNPGLHGARGIVIPHLAEGNIWGVKIRRYKGWEPAKDPKYTQIKGSKSGLFGSDRLRQDGRPLLLLEGEKDCLLAWQELRELADVATLAGATKGLPDRWFPYVLPYRHIFVAYDADKAGAEGAQRVKKLSKRFARISVPVGGDLVGFWQVRGDLRAWLSYELAAHRW